ncbi:hypothetical protein ACOME3_003846 [Neoechinorhynchus agilis]
MFSAVILLLTALSVTKQQITNVEQFTYRCKSGICIKELLNPVRFEPQVSLAECILFCKSTVWPMPTIEFTTSGEFELCPGSVDLMFTRDAFKDGFHESLGNEFLSAIEKLVPEGTKCKRKSSVQIVIDYDGNEIFNPVSSFGNYPLAKDRYELSIKSSETTLSININGSISLVLNFRR